VTKLSKIPPNKGRGYVIVSGQLQDGNLSKLAEAVNKALTPHRDQVKPSVSLELFAKLDKESAAAAKKALEDIEGVDAKKSTANLKRGVLAVRLTGGKSLTVSTIVAALKQAGIDLN